MPEKQLWVVAKVVILDVATPAKVAAAMDVAQHAAVNVLVLAMQLV